MRDLSDTIRRLAALRGPGIRIGDSVPHSTDRLSGLADFGSNPGALLAKIHVPEGLVRGAPLVVVLHGCTQTAGDYDDGAGWSRLADTHGFALLFPEQQRSNNMNLCFNWFAPDDIRRGAGEVLSIRQMIEAMVITHAIDRRRVFVNGLSAGGAMTAALLATYPDVFAGGAIIAGLPFDCAGTIPEAFDRMRGQGMPSDEELQKSLREATTHTGPWPTVSVWHGSNDRIVVPSNADAIIAQWREVHEVEVAPSTVTTVDGHSLHTWTGRDGRPLIEKYLIAGMGHGTPIAAGAENGDGKAGPYMLDFGVSSTRKLLETWRLTAPAKHSFAGLAELIIGTPAVAEQGNETGRRKPTSSDDEIRPEAKKPVGIKAIIENALRSAGLMK
jgi:poly(hydroxyalkanoate) depolymerase family esterase